MRCCWPRRLGGDAGRVHRGGSVGQGAKEVLLAEGTVAKRMRHRGRSGSIGKKLRGMEQCTKKPAGVSGCETLAGVR